MSKKTILITILVVILLGVIGFVAFYYQETINTTNPTTKYCRGEDQWYGGLFNCEEIFINFYDWVSKETIDAFLNDLNMRVISNPDKLGLNKLYRVQVPKGFGVFQIIKKIMAFPEVKYVEPIPIYFLQK